jgi:NAD(P)-dependent dehydrogenase (short-subunit alcohol dehydrogenase family)
MTAPGRNGAPAPTCRSNAVDSRKPKVATPKPVALITGGAKGIGRAIARHLASSGWRLGLVDLPGSGLRRADPRRSNIVSIEGDVRDEAFVAGAVEALLQRFGRLDGVVSNAGIMKRMSAAFA